MSWIPDEDSRERDNRKGHVTPPDRNPVPERDQQQDDREERKRE
jgi:hypothetical protein